MVKRVIILVAMIYNFTSARIITVDNKYPFTCDYQELSAAYEVATSGDTIYISPSARPYYLSVNIQKRIHLVGVGFDITESFGGTPTQTASFESIIKFSPGSEGSVIEGLDGGFIVYVEAPNITIKHNDLKQVNFTDQGSGSVIIGNKIIASGVNAYSPAISLSNAYNVLMANNIIINPNISSVYGNTDHGISGGVDPLIYSNILKADGGYCLYATEGAQVVNNIFLSKEVNSCGNCSFQYNATSTMSFDGEGNISILDINTVFVDWVHGNYHLSPTSPAKGTGQNGTDMGIYGGEEPYVDCGFPGIPSILQLEGDLFAAPGTGLNIKFRAKSN